MEDLSLKPYEEAVNLLPRPDVGSYQMIQVGLAKAAVVPISELLRFRALELMASPEMHENAELAAGFALDDLLPDRELSIPIDQVKRLLGLEASFGARSPEGDR